MYQEIPLTYEQLYLQILKEGQWKIIIHAVKFTDQLFYKTIFFT